MTNVTHLHRPDPEWHCRIGRVYQHNAHNVVQVGVASPLDYDPTMILANAMSDGMSCVVVIGYDLDNEDYFASSTADGGTVLWLMERAKQRLMNVASTLERTGPATA